MAKKKSKKSQKPSKAAIVIIILVVIAAIVYLYTVPREKWPAQVRAEIGQVESDWGVKIGKQAEETAGVAAVQAEVPSAQPASSTASGPAPRWLELPAGGNSGLTHWATMGGRRQRNYTMLYDPSVYAS